MKAILKTLLLELDLKYDETFTSETNTEICRRLVSELFKSLKPRYNPIHEQLNIGFRPYINIGEAVIIMTGEEDSIRIINGYTAIIGLMKYINKSVHVCLLLL